MAQARKKRKLSADAGHENGKMADESALSSLLRLPSPLLALVLQLVPLPDKLAQLTRLHRSFPPLQPAHFAFDCLSFTPQLRAAWHSSSRLQQLLSGVRAVQFLDTVVAQRPDCGAEVGWRVPTVQHEEQEEQHWEAVILTTPLSPSPSTFTAVQQLIVQVLPATGECPKGVMGPLFAAPAGAYAHLHSLYIEALHHRELMLPLQAAFVRPLLSLPCLRTLQLEADPRNPLHWTAFRLLLSLPLVHLDLTQMEVDIPVTARQFLDGSEVASLPITDTWQVLMLPDIGKEGDSRNELLGGLLQQYMDGKGALMRIWRHGQTRDGTTCLARLRTLQSLEMSSRERVVNLQPLYTPNAVFSSAPSSASAPSITTAASWSPPRLPSLRHLRLRNHAAASDDLPPLRKEVGIRQATRTRTSTQ